LAQPLASIEQGLRGLARNHRIAMIQLMIRRLTAKK
jgi:hypothetical protein